MGDECHGKKGDKRDWLMVVVATTFNNAVCVWLCADLLFLPILYHIDFIQNCHRWADSFDSRPNNNNNNNVDEEQ
jgi:hypothetical protein